MTSSEPGRPSRGLARRILAFAGLPFLSLVTPFLFLPLLARIAGEGAWLSIAVGQSVGAFLALIVALGYNTVGPTIVAVASAAERPALLARSIRARLVLFAPSAIVAVLVTLLIAPDGHRVEGALMSLTMAFTGLGSAWYMIGLGKAGLIAVYDILPRMLATLIAAGILLLTGSVIWYPVLLLIIPVLSMLVFLHRHMGLRQLRQTEAGEIRATLRGNRSVMGVEIAGGAYNSLAVTLVSVTAPVAQAAAYASGDKLYRIGQYSVSALGNALQGWVVEDGREQFAHRARRALLLHLALGLAGFAGFALLGPWLSGALFGDTVAIDLPTALGLGVATIGIALGTAVGRVILIALGARREFLISVIVGACVGVPAILILAAHFGAAGGAWGLALGEAASVTGQSIFARMRWKTGTIIAPAPPGPPATAA